jgi:hypothetical protein
MGRRRARWVMILEYHRYRGSAVPLDFATADAFEAVVICDVPPF